MGLVLIQVLGRYAEPVSPGDPSSESFSSSATGDEERPVSDWEIAWEYFGKWHVLLALVSLSFIIVHIFLAPRRLMVGLDFWGINFPSSVTELITSAIVVIQVEQVAIMAFNFLRSRYWQGKSHFSLPPYILNYAGLKWSLLLIGPLYLRGIWHGL